MISYSAQKVVCILLEEAQNGKLFAILMRTGGHLLVIKKKTDELQVGATVPRSEQQSQLLGKEKRPWKSDEEVTNCYKDISSLRDKK